MTDRTVTYEDLIAFASGELSGPDAERVRAHIDRSPEAARTVALYRRARDVARGDDSVAAPDHVIERAKAIFRPRAAGAPAWWTTLEAIVARLVYDSRLQPALVRTTATGDRIQLGYETEVAQVDLQAQRHEPEDGGAPVWHVIGQCAVENDGAGIEVALTAQGSDDVASRTQSDDAGMFEVRVAPGRYDMHLRVGTTAVLVPGIELP